MPYLLSLMLFTILAGATANFHLLNPLSFTAILFGASTLTVFTYGCRSTTSGRTLLRAAKMTSPMVFISVLIGGLSSWGLYLLAGTIQLEITSLLIAVFSSIVLTILVMRTLLIEAYRERAALDVAIEASVYSAYLWDAKEQELDLQWSLGLTALELPDFETLYELASTPDEFAPQLSVSAFSIPPGAR